MSGTLHGADLEALDMLASQLERQAAQLSTLTNQATSGVTTLARLWEGPDSAQYRQLWHTTHRPKMNFATQELRDAVATIQRNRQAQDLTSSANGGGVSGWGGGPGSLGASALNFGDDSVVGDITDFLFGDIANFWGGGDDGFPVGSLGAALLRMSRVARGDLPLFNTGFVGTRLASLLQGGPGVLGQAGTWLASPGASTFFKWAGVTGGVVSTGVGLYDLYQQGNPIDAFQENGAGYVADVASTAFSASSTAFLLAPNPVTGALVLGTGAVWLGAEVVDNWDSITDWTSDTWDAGTDFVGDVGGAAVDLGGDALDLAGDLGGGALDLAGDIGNKLTSPSDWF
jgi:uncharacterized protein YukE